MWPGQCGLDLPSHPNVACLQLNPASSGLYSVLETIFSDMLAMFSPSAFHMGGDEIHVGCWNSSEDITQWLESQVGLLCRHFTMFHICCWDITR